MKRDYEDSIREICQIGNWRKPYGVPIDEIGIEARASERSLVAVANKKGHETSDFEQALSERQGAVGVACVLSYLNGVKASVGDMAKHLGISPAEVEVPFRRLLVNGVFSSKQDIRSDLTLAGEANEVISQFICRTREGRMQTAWGVLAGIASGFCGLRETTPVAA